LAFLSSAAEQNYKAFTVTAKIDSISRTEVDAVFMKGQKIYRELFSPFYTETVNGDATNRHENPETGK